MTDINKTGRILWLTENYYPSLGGMAQSCDRITWHLHQKGVPVHIFHLTLRKAAYKTEETGSGWYTAFPPEQDPAHTFHRLWNYLQTFPKGTFNAIVAFGGNMPMIGAPILAKWLHIPLLTCIRGNDFDAALFSPKKRDILLYALQNSSAILSVSKDKISRIEAVVPDIPVHYCPNGIQIDDWQLLESEEVFSAAVKNSPIHKNHTLIGIFGHLKTKKGLQFFLECLGDAAKRHPISLLLVGELDEDSKIAWENSEISHQILPFIERMELIKYYAACDWIAIPSFYDGMPNVLLEAGALGIPLIASNVDGMKDVLCNETSCLFEAGQIYSCKEALSRALTLSDNDRLSMGKKLQQRIKTEFSAENEALTYIDIFSKLSLLPIPQWV